MLYVQVPEDIPVQIGRPLKVLIVGSTPDQTDEHTPEFEFACFEIGKALADAGMDIIIGSCRERTADLHVLKGFSDVPGNHTVWLLRPSDERQLTLPELKENVTLRRKIVQGPWPAGRVPQILEADAVVLVKGAATTRICGYVAPSLERPVVSVASFGGSAKELWAHLYPYYCKAGRISDDVAALCRPWEASTAKVVPVVIKELVRKRAFQARRIGPLATCMLITLLGLLFWVVLFVEATRDQVYPFFAMVVIAGVLGVLLRNNMRMILDPTITFSWTSLVLEVQAGILLGFALGLLYLAGVITVTGQAQPLADGNAGAFQRVAVIMTLIAFGAGYRLQQASARV
jgi:hypothetical protein